MSTRNTHYVYGSAARQLEAAPLRRREEEIRRQQEQRRHQKPKKRVDRVAVFWTVVTFSVVMFVSLFYIRLQFQSTYLSKSVVNLQSEVVNMERENTVAEMELDNNVDLTEIYRKATKELGMCQPKDNQVFTYESKKSTQVRQHSAISDD